MPPAVVVMELSCDDFTRTRLDVGDGLIFHSEILIIECPHRKA